MRVQAQVVENVQADSGLLAELVSQSQSASGSLQVSQATNQLIALSTKQQLQIQQMMAAQYSADAIEQARQQQAMEAERERQKRFIGADHKYTRKRSDRRRVGKDDETRVDHGGRHIRQKQKQCKKK